MVLKVVLKEDTVNNLKLAKISITRVNGTMVKRLSHNKHLMIGNNKTNNSVEVTATLKLQRLLFILRYLTTATFTNKPHITPIPTPR